MFPCVRVCVCATSYIDDGVLEFDVEPVVGDGDDDVIGLA